MRNKKLIRIIAIVLAVLLAGGVVFGALMSALAEAPGADAPRNRQTLSIEYMEDQQALHITQRLLYVNDSPDRLDSVLFCAAGNMLRRQAALMYDPDEAQRVFFEGFAPAGIELLSVRCDGQPADYGFQGEAETALRVACDVQSGGSCAFEFEYYLLLARCGAFQGVGDTDVRLSAFYFSPGVYDARYGEFALKKPLPFTRWLYSAPADFEVELSLPEGWLPAASGPVERVGGEGGRCLWRSRLDGAREFALCFGRRYRAFERQTASGVRLRVLTNIRGAGSRALDVMQRAVEQCEEWFGAFPVPELCVAQSDYPLGALSFPGTAWLPTELMRPGSRADMAHRLRTCVAQQYFGLAAGVEPVADAWMTDAVSEYVACLLLEAEAGEDRFLAYVNRDWVSALQQTVPGGLRVTSDAALFTAGSYDVVVRRRGAVVLHELRLAMGLDGLLAGLAEFCRMGRDGRTLTEMDFVAALDAATGESWEEFLTDWLFNVDDYADQTMFWYE